MLRTFNCNYNLIIILSKFKFGYYVLSRLFARQQRLYAASLCLSATVLLLDWTSTTAAETARFEEGTQI